MDKVTEKRGTCPVVASAEEIPQSEFLISFSNDPNQFTGSESSSYLSDVSSLSFSSPSSSFSSSYSDEPLSDFSEMLAQLPIKRGLSKYYKGKSRTFTSLSDVKSIEDFAKREIPYRKRAQNPSSHSPKAIISKKTGRSCFTSLESKWS